jgi:Trk K+ transport system NAD-binding subunit
MSFNAKRNDVTKFTAGTWVEIFGARWKVARAGNPEYDQALEESGYRRTEDPAKKQRALYTAIAEGVLKDWEDVVDNDGQPIPYSVDNAVEVLLENPDLVGEVLREANTLSNYRREDVATQKKKRATSSAGKPATSE